VGIRSKESLRARWAISRGGQDKWVHAEPAKERREEKENAIQHIGMGGYVVLGGLSNLGKKKRGKGTHQ